MLLSDAIIAMPETPVPENEGSPVVYQPQPERPQNNSVVRELTQTDRLNKRLLVSVLEKMNKSDGQFDRFMEKESPNEPQEESDF